MANNEKKVDMAEVKRITDEAIRKAEVAKKNEKALLADLGEDSKCSACGREMELYDHPHGYPVYEAYPPFAFPAAKYICLNSNCPNCWTGEGEDE